MSYKSCEDALIVIIQKLSDYDTDNCTAGDFRALASGKPKVVITEPGAFQRNMAQSNRMRSVWAITLNLFINYGGELSEAAETIRTARQELITQIDKYPTLDSEAGVVLGQLQAGEEPEIWEVGAEHYWKQTMTVTVEERVTVTYSE